MSAEEQRRWAQAWRDIERRNRMDLPKPNRPVMHWIAWAIALIGIAACCVIVHRAGGQGDERRMEQTR